MRDETEVLLDAQRAIRVQLDLRGITLKVLAARSNVPYSSLCCYFPGNERGSTPKRPTELPASVIYKLCGALDDDLLNLLCPEGFALVRKPEGVDYDDLAHGCRIFLEAKDQAHHPESENGRDLGPTETARLDRLATIGGAPKLRVVGE